VPHRDFAALTTVFLKPQHVLLPVVLEITQPQLGRRTAPTGGIGQRAEDCPVTQAHDMAGIDGRQQRAGVLNSPLDPGHEPIHRPQVGFLHVPVMVFGIEIFIPGEACRTACPLDQGGQHRTGGDNWHHW
jgi:hypothetical protein